MAKKKLYDEFGNEIRSRPPKSFYKKSRFWGIILLGCLFVSIGSYALFNEDEGTKKTKEHGVREGKTEAKKSELAKSEEVGEEETYTYEDFKGTYVTFEGEPYQSPIKEISDIIVLGEDFYRSFDRWEFDMTSTILDKTIEGNVLTIDVESDENEVWGLHSETGTEEFELRYDGDKKVLYSIKRDSSLYFMSSKELQTYYNQMEIDYARIILTVYGDPTTGLWSLEYVEEGASVVDVSYSSAGDPIDTSGEVYYPKDVTHLDVTELWKEERIITYSLHSEGNITIYPTQTEEDRKNAQESLDNAETIYIEPFEPYIVADFIERVEFIDE